jgi:selenide,water dikinase
VLINGYRGGLLTAEQFEPLLREQVKLNREASAIALAFGATGATDITGFGLVGHALEMARAGNLQLQLQAGALPAHDLARKMVAEGIGTRGQHENQKDAQAFLTLSPGVDAAQQALCFDPQTNGGLLFGVEPSRADACLEALKAAGVTCAACVGTVVRAGPPAVEVVA